MMSTRLMIGLGVAYLVIIVVALCERPTNWPRALYFLGAVLITVAILWMGDK